MAATNTITHRRMFEDLIGDGDRQGEGDDVALAILFAAIAAARARLGAAETERAVSRFLAGEAPMH